MKVVNQTKQKEDLWYIEQKKSWFKPYQIVKMKFESNVGTGSLILPVLVSRVNLLGDRPPSIDIIFSLNWMSNEEGGYLTIQDVMLGRYLAENQKITENDLNHVKSFLTDKFNIANIFYIDNETDTTRDLIYPFKNEVEN